MSTPVIAFDLNETLLDLSALDPVFEELFGDASLRAVWFAQMLEVAFVGDHRPIRRRKLVRSVPHSLLQAGGPA